MKGKFRKTIYIMAFIKLAFFLLIFIWWGGGGVVLARQPHLLRACHFASRLVATEAVIFTYIV
jgi:hypothetical protein